jgi:hypothetical protein
VATKKTAQKLCRRHARRAYDESARDTKGARNMQRLFPLGAGLNSTTAC